MAKFIGGFIGYLFVAMIVLGPGFGLYHASKETIKALAYSGRAEAEIVGCSTFTDGRNSNGNLRYITVPHARMQSGQIVNGTVDEIRFIYRCKNQIGKKVNVLFDEDRPSQAKLNTFLEMWFLPLIIGVICLLVYSALIAGYLKKKKK